MKLDFKIDTVEERLLLYRYLKYRYTLRGKSSHLPYKLDVIDPFSLGICFYLSHRTTVKFEDLPEMVEEYKKIKKTGVLLAPAGHIPERVKFINNVINNIKIKTNGKECNRKATATIARSNKKPSN